jgi:HAD superfamily hydrolase (TIGR01509 family)
MRGIAAALFDLDGTLVDSEKLKARALSETISRLGGVASAELYQQVMGSSWETVRKHFLINSAVSAEAEEFDSIFRLLYGELISTEVVARPCTHKYLKQLKNSGIKIGLVSSAARWMADGILERTGLTGMFDVIVVREDVTTHKPDPEAYLLALERMRVKCTETVVFEDSEAGVAAGWRAGCSVTAVRHEYNSNHDLSKAKSVINSFEELLVDAIDE